MNFNLFLNFPNSLLYLDNDNILSTQQKTRDYAKEEVEFGTESEDSSEELTDIDEVFQSTELKRVTHFWNKGDSVFTGKLL